jgi:DMSO/TMAO reductase YedYZ molybdopterin-dependent catalytic subunit
MIFDDKRKRLQGELRESGRLPSGQSLTLKWPVLHVGTVPSFDPERWDFKVCGLVENPFCFKWHEFQKLHRKKINADFHCVTSWSKFDNEWEGVPFSVIAEKARPKPEARFVMVLSENNYTTNLPLEDLMADDVIFADRHAPEPLDATHGAPLRLVVPHLYAWKSAKWVRGLNFIAEDEPGYWERFGYHMYGDPFREQRFQS